MKINRLMQAVFVAGSACVVLPAFAGSTPSLTSSTTESSLPQCGGDEDDDDGDEDGDDDQGETRLCGGDSDDDDGDEDGDEDDGGETRAPAL